VRTVAPEQQPSLVARYLEVRGRTTWLSERLSAEDCQVQSMPDASPTKWHLAHTTWFFEAFVLGRDPQYTAVNPDYSFLFNSYYQAVGPMHDRPRRGVVSRPRLVEVLEYRERVDAAVKLRLEAGTLDAEALELIELGLHHEQQHQELLLTDIMHAFSGSVLYPAFAVGVRGSDTESRPLEWVAHEGGICEVGHAGPAFAYDNEGPAHRVFLEPFALASRPVTNAEFLEFLDDGGYRTARHWLNSAWAHIQNQGWEHPGYWQCKDGEWSGFGLGGLRTLDLHAPVTNLSYYEADAFARWAGARLPTEFEWEAMAAPRFERARARGNFVEDENWRTVAGGHGVDGVAQLAGDVWEWTSSSYAPYPGYKAAPGAVGEYNGKFMVDQYVLRGGSMASPRSHLRVSYRNFFPTTSRWQFSGLRLARSAS
jgi:ergothioneine biosynthesis protein EgtB